MITVEQRLENTEAAVLELSMFFIRHSLPHWPAKMSPVLESLRARDGMRALEIWAGIALMGEYGLMQTRITYEDGYRADDLYAEQQHFERLLQQTLDAINSLRLHLRSGVKKPLIDIHPDRPL